jgi:ribonuclease D
MQKYFDKIPDDILDELPLKGFEGEIFLIDNFKDLEIAVEILNGKKILGFDTETKPAFKKGITHKVSLLQLATDKQAFLFRLNEIGLPDSLASILSDEKIIKIGAAIKDDIKALKKLNKFTPRNFIELQSFVDEFGIEDNGLKKITANVLGFKISKGARLTNWESPDLTFAQLNYAATDAWVSHKIYCKLTNQL